MKPDQLSDWPTHMRVVFRVIGESIIGKQLRPEHLDHLSLDDRSIIPDHQVTISHTPKAETGQKRGLYLIVISGPRIDGSWNLSPGLMDRLSREAAVTADVSR
jgi:hypothetical protein